MRGNRFATKYGERSPEQWADVRERIREAVKPFCLGALIEDRAPSSRYLGALRELVFERGSILICVYREPVTEHTAFGARLWTCAIGDTTNINEEVSNGNGTT